MLPLQGNDLYWQRIPWALPTAITFHAVGVKAGAFEQQIQNCLSIRSNHHPSRAARGGSPTALGTDTCFVVSNPLSFW